MAITNQDSLPVVDESIDNVEKSVGKYIWKRKYFLAAFLLGMIILEILFLKFFVQLVFVPLFVIIGYVAYVRDTVIHEFMKQFALANNFSYAKHGSMDGLNGALFQIGHDKGVSDFIGGNYENCPIRLFNYSYMTGEGKSSRLHAATVFELNFEAAMPDILLERKFGSQAFLGGNNRKSLKLEGNFGDYFNLEVQEGYEIEALQVLTPDIMEDLIEKAKLFSIEIINNHLFIYDNKTIVTKQELYAFYELAEYFVQKIGPVLSCMKKSTEVTMQVMEESNKS